MCGNADPYSVYTDDMAMVSELQSPGQDESDRFGFNGAAWGNNGLSWSACAQFQSPPGYTIRGSLHFQEGVCHACERTDIGTAFVWNTHCYSIIRGSNVDRDTKKFGNSGPAWSKDALSWSTCAPGLCYVCDRSEVTDRFEWDTHCYLMNPPSIGGIGESTPAWSNNGLSWSVCDPSKNSDKGACYVCDRAERTAFDWTNDCYEMKPNDHVGTRFGMSEGVFWGNNGLSWSNCALTRDPTPGECFVCDRADVTTRFEWGTHCYPFIPGNPGDKYIGIGSYGISLSDDGLSWSSCDSVTCYLCHRADARTPFEGGTDCNPIVIPSSATRVAGGTGGGPVSMSNNGTTWSICRTDVCYACHFADAGTPFDWANDCIEIAPEVNDYFGMDGSAWSNNGQLMTACDYGRNADEENPDLGYVESDLGWCYICKCCMHMIHLRSTRYIYA